MTTTGPLAIVGAGLAGAKAAEGAREAGFTGPIILVGEEGRPPYERPPLSKSVLQGTDEPGSTRVHPAGYYADNGIDVIHGHVRSVDSTARTIDIDGDEIGFDRAIIATGSTPRRLTVPGAELAGVHHLRTLDDSLRLRDTIRAAARVVVIGAGWIGTEVAASARMMGAEVAVVDPAPVPLHRVLGTEIGAAFHDLHADHGVAMHLEVGVKELQGSGSVERVVLSNGRTLAADAVVVGIGVEPCTASVSGTEGIEVRDGIVTDEHLRTGAPGIWAAGDVANAWHPRYRRHLRVEHWANALNQGLAAGRNAAGDGEVYDRVPYFYSDQFDVGLEYVGHADATNAVVVRGDISARRFIALWHDDGFPMAAMTVDIWDVVDDLKAIASSERPVDLDSFRDEGTPLASIVPTAVAR